MSWKKRMQEILKYIYIKIARTELMSAVAFAFTPRINKCYLDSAHVVIESQYKSELGMNGGLANKYGQY